MQKSSLNTQLLGLACASPVPPLAHTIMSTCTHNALYHPPGRPNTDTHTQRQQLCTKLPGHSACCPVLGSRQSRQHDTLPALRKSTYTHMLHTYTHSTRIARIRWPLPNARYNKHCATRVYEAELHCLQKLRSNAKTHVYHSKPAAFRSILQAGVK